MQQLCQTVPLKLQVAQMFQAWQKRDQIIEHNLKTNIGIITA